jgi:hypothetical protein
LVGNITHSVIAIPRTKNVKVSLFSYKIFFFNKSQIKLKYLFKTRTL